VLDSAAKVSHVVVRRDDDGWTSSPEPVDEEGTFAIPVSLAPRQWSRASRSWTATWSARAGAISTPRRRRGVRCSTWTVPWRRSRRRSRGPVRALWELLPADAKKNTSTWSLARAIPMERGENPRGPRRAHARGGARRAGGARHCGAARRARASRRRAAEAGATRAVRARHARRRLEARSARATRARTPRTGEVPPSLRCSRRPPLCCARW